MPGTYYEIARAHRLRRAKDRRRRAFWRRVELNFDDIMCGGILLVAAIVLSVPIVTFYLHHVHH